MMKYEGICEWCGKPTYSKYKSTLKRFCSYQCSSAWKWANVRKRKEFVSFKCSNCGKEILVDKTDHRVRNGQILWFCDHKCESEFRISQRELSLCPICGKAFYKIKTKTCCSECGIKLKKLNSFKKKFGNSELTYDDYLKFIKEECERKDRCKKVITSNGAVRYYENDFVCSGREKEYMKEYHNTHKNERKEQHEKRMKDDELYRFKVKIRKFICQSFRRMSESKTIRTEDVVGCSFLELKKHLQDLFQEGMNWDNYGKWHIDHIVPLSTAKCQEDVIRLCHYTNLQPLWAEDNIRKGAKVY